LEFFPGIEWWRWVGNRNNDWKYPIFMPHLVAQMWKMVNGHLKNLNPVARCAGEKNKKKESSGENCEERGFSLAWSCPYH